MNHATIKDRRVNKFSTTNTRDIMLALASHSVTWGFVMLPGASLTARHPLQDPIQGLNRHPEALIDAAIRYIPAARSRRLAIDQCPPVPEASSTIISILYLTFGSLYFSPLPPPFPCPPLSPLSLLLLLPLLGVPFCITIAPTYCICLVVFLLTQQSNS